MGYTKYREDGTIEEQYCYEYSSVDKVDESNFDGQIRECPRYANNGCFKGSNSIEAGSIHEDNLSNSFNKGQKNLYNITYII